MANNFSSNNSGTGPLPTFLAQFDEVTCKANFDEGVRMAERGDKHPATWDEAKITWDEAWKSYPGYNPEIPKKYHQCMVEGYESVKGKTPPSPTPGEDDGKSDNTALVVGAGVVGLGILGLLWLGKKRI